MIRKTAFLITGTVAGVVGVLSYNPPQLNNSIASSNTNPVPATKPSATTSTNQTTPTKSPAPASTKTKAAAKPTQSATQSSTKPQSTTTVSTSGTFAGDTSQTRWGPVQVQVTVSDGKITDISTLQYPNGDRRSLGISNQVIPWLQQEVLKVQSANISGISGATYTSNGFKASLASALQKAGL